MDQVLGVVDHDGLEVQAVALFVESHVLVDPVQAIGFRGRTVVRANGEVKVGTAGLHLPAFIECPGVVRIRAEKEVVVAIVDGGTVVIHHRADNFVLVPHRHENGGQRLQVMLGQRPVELGGEAGGDPDRVDEQVIEAAEENPSRNREYHDPESRVDVLEDAGDRLHLY